MKELAHRNPSALIEHFKLHLHPSSIQFESKPTSLASTFDNLSLDTSASQDVQLILLPDFEATPLPEGVDVYASYFRYLYDNSKSWFLDNTLGGDKIWNDVVEKGDKVEFVLGVPDGYDDFQQITLRKALVKAGAVDEDGAESKVSFLREAEVSFLSLELCLKEF